MKAKDNQILIFFVKLMCFRDPAPKRFEFFIILLRHATQVRYLKREQEQIYRPNQYTPVDPIILGQISPRLSGYYNLFLRFDHVIGLTDCRFWVHLLIDFFSLSSFMATIGLILRFKICQCWFEISLLRLKICSVIRNLNTPAFGRSPRAALADQAGFSE